MPKKKDSFKPKEKLPLRDTLPHRPPLFSRQKIYGSTVAMAVFSLLFYLGLRNVWASETNNQNQIAFLSPLSLFSKMENIASELKISPAPQIEPEERPTSLVSGLEESQVLSASASTNEKNEITETGMKLMVKTGDASVKANIRQEASADSKAISQAQDGDIFEFVSQDPDWYEIKLADNSTGFISTICVVEIEETFSREKIDN